MQKVADWVAVPDVSVAVPSEPEVVVSVNVTVPVAADGETVAVRFTLSPVVSVPVVVVVRTVLVVVRLDDAPTVRESALDVLEASLVSPPYFAVSEYVPAVAIEVVSVAVPELSVPVPSEDVPL